MKRIIFLTIFGLILSSAYADEHWLEAIKSDRVSVSVENALYEQEGHPNFFIHVKLTNRANRILGVDFQDQWKVVYPNQWGGSDLDHRTVINEREMIPKKLDSTLRKELLEAYSFKKMKSIPAGNDSDYYVNFNASGRKDVDKAQGKYILISIKGQMFFSDGSQVWDENSGYDLAILKPIEWKTIPKDAMTITH